MGTTDKEKPPWMQAYISKHEPRPSIAGRVLVAALFIGFFAILFVFLPGGRWIWALVLLFALFGAAGGGGWLGD